MVNKATGLKEVNGRLYRVNMSKEEKELQERQFMEQAAAIHKPSLDDYIHDNLPIFNN